MCEFSKNRDQAEQAADRFISICEKMGFAKKWNKLDVFMDLSAADGVNGNPKIDWNRLNKADDHNFTHDVAGISKHMCRETGKITDHFLPLFTKQNEVAL